MIKIPAISLTQEPLPLEGGYIWHARLILKIENSQEIKDEEDLNIVTAMIDSMIGEYIAKVPKDRKGYLDPCLEKIPTYFQLAFDHVIKSWLPIMKEGDIATDISLNIHIFRDEQDTIKNVYVMETYLHIDELDGREPFKIQCQSGSHYFSLGKKEK